MVKHSVVAYRTQHIWERHLYTIDNQENQGYNEGMHETNLVWIDLEMTGLNPETDVILEIATIITDQELAVLAEGPDLVIHCDESFINALPETQKDFLKEDGLLVDAPASDVLLEDAEQQTLNVIKEYVPEKCGVLCGNSIGQDKRFLYKYMPLLSDYLHYRSIDVSSVKELARRWRPDILELVQKKNTHRALDDIKESIEELQVYREHFFRLD